MSSDFPLTPTPFKNDTFVSLVYLVHIYSFLNGKPVAKLLCAKNYPQSQLSELSISVFAMQIEKRTSVLLRVNEDVSQFPS